MDNFQIVEILAFAIMCITIVTPVIKLNQTVTELKCAVQEFRGLINTSAVRIETLEARVDTLDGRFTELITEHHINHRKG